MNKNLLRDQVELQLRISGMHYDKLRQHLLPDDGKEAVAVALCGHFKDNEKEILTIFDMTFIPYDKCSNRDNNMLTWPTDLIHRYFERISKSNLSILKLHSHPGGFNEFSLLDDQSDLEFFKSAFGWSSEKQCHASAIMLPDGRIFGRFFFNDLTYKPINRILISGDEILCFSEIYSRVSRDFALRTIQAFGEKTNKLLQNLRIGVVGCSGTGSIVIEQLARLGAGSLVLVDPDIVETKNLNRIINATIEDAKKAKPKVTVLSKSIKNIGLGTQVESYNTNLYDDIRCLRALIKCDVIFGCVDSVDGRFLLNQLSTFYLLPYFDLGVKLEADGNGGISKICGSVNYLQPGKSSLITRGVYTIDDLKSASQYRRNPEEFKNLRKNAYIKNVNVNSPAVISVNMSIASLAVNEFLNRIHLFKSDPPSKSARSTIDITESYISNTDELDFPLDNYLFKKCGRGDITPFIEIPEIINES